MYYIFRLSEITDEWQKSIHENEALKTNAKTLNKIRFCMLLASMIWQMVILPI